VQLYPSLRFAKRFSLIRHYSKMALKRKSVAMFLMKFFGIAICKWAVCQEFVWIRLHQNGPDEKISNSNDSQPKIYCLHFSWPPIMAPINDALNSPCADAEPKRWQNYSKAALLVILCHIAPTIKCFFWPVNIFEVSR